MAAAYVVNLNIDTNTTFTQTFNLSTDSGSPLNLSGYNVKSQMRKHPQSSSYVNFIATAIYPPSGGIISIELESQTSNSLKPGRYMYDVIIENNTTNEKIKVVEGSVIVSTSITRDS